MGLALDHPIKAEPDGEMWKAGLVGCLVLLMEASCYHGEFGNSSTLPLGGWSKKPFQRNL